jgi:predicted nucleic acid-binding Zn ribbon protein
MTRRGAPDRPALGPEDIGAILSRWLGSAEAKERLKEDGIFARWPEIVGPERAALSRVVRCAGGVVTVEVASPPLLHELGTYLREEVLQAIRERPELGPIREIRFRAGAAAGAGEAAGRLGAASGVAKEKRTRGGMKREGKRA